MKALRLLGASVVLALLLSWNSHAQQLASDPSAAEMLEDQRKLIRHLKQQIALLRKERDELRLEVRELESHVSAVEITRPRRHPQVPEAVDRGMMMDALQNNGLRFELQPHVEVPPKVQWIERDELPVPQQPSQP